MSNSEILTGQIEQTDCPNPVLDESTPNSNQVDLDLQQEIDQFSGVGVKVFLVNIESMREEGYPVTDDMSDGEFSATVDAYVRDLMSTCGIDSQDALVLVRVWGDRATNIGASGSQADYESSNWQDFDDFVGNFHNKSAGADPSTVQDAAALALKNFYLVEFKKESASPQVGTPEVGVEPKDSSDSSLPLIISPMIGLLALAGGTYAIVKGVEKHKEGNVLLNRVKNLYGEYNRRTTAAFTQDKTGDNLKDPIVEGSAAFINDIPADDIPEITRLRQIIQEGYDEWKISSANMAKILANAKKRFRVDKSALGLLELQLQPRRNDYYSDIIRFENEIESVVEKRANLLAQLGELGAKLETLEAETAKLTVSDAEVDSDGQSSVYTMPSLVEKLAKLKLTFQQAYDMHIVDKKVNEPFNLVANINESLDELIELTQSIPELHQEINANYNDLSPMFAQLTSQQENTQVSVADLTENYHDNCLGTSMDDFEDMQSQLKQIKELKKNIANPNTTFNVDELLEIRATLLRIAKHKKQFDFRFEAIRTQVTTIKELEAQSTQDIQEINDTLLQTEDYIDENRTFIDDETEEEIDLSIEKLKALQQQRSEKKPDFVKLNQDIESLKVETQQYLNKVVAEHKEILNLEQGIQIATAEFEEDFIDIAKYKQDSDVDSQTKSDIQNAEDDIDTIKSRPLSATAENRLALRAQKKHLDEANDYLEELKKDVKGDKAREEQKREQIRQQLLEAERQRQRAEQAREQARQDAAERARTTVSHTRMDSPSHARVGGGSHTRRG